ncbi:hypothetical protein LCGC14_3119640, partial [marine sediment metagenome]
MEKIPLTRAGHTALNDELKKLKSVERPAIIRAIAEAREHGDLSENAEYHSAREKQSFIEGRIKELEGILSLAEVIDPSKLSGSIKFGARITLVDEDTDEEKTYQIVGEPEEREWSFDLVQAFPRNSTLWATDPKTQICYTAVRRFANVAAPGILMGVPFDREDWAESSPEHAKDITPPRPQRDDFTAADGSQVPEDKSLREHYVEQADARQQAAEPDLDAEHRRVTTGYVGDEPEEGETTETPSEDATGAEGPGGGEGTP